jgi:hypothetical protein
MMVIVTDQSQLDRERLPKDARLVVDTRDALRGVSGDRSRVYGLYRSSRAAPTSALLLLQGILMPRQLHLVSQITVCLCVERARRSCVSRP